MGNFIFIFLSQAIFRFSVDGRKVAVSGLPSTPWASHLLPARNPGCSNGNNQPGNPYPAGSHFTERTGIDNSLPLNDDLNTSQFPRQPQGSASRDLNKAQHFLSG